MVLRIKFNKHGAIKFIGHLDIMRYFQKACRRADLDVKYSNGFNPHQMTSFAAPFGVGFESDGEYFDMEMNSVTSSNDIMKRLNDNMAEGIQILSVKMMPENGRNAMASVGAASYTVRFRKEVLPFSLEEAVQRFLSEDEVQIQKQTKKTNAFIDLKPAVYHIEASDTDKSVTMLVNASSAGNIKPLYVVQALFSMYSAEVSPLDIMINRNDTLLGPEDSFKSLDSMAEEF